MVTDLVVLIRNPQHPRYGEIGALTGHDMDGGTLFVRFADGADEQFPDGGALVSRYHRRNDEEGKKYDADSRKLGPRSFASDYLALGVGDLRALTKMYKKIFGEEFHDGRLI